MSLITAVIFLSVVSISLIAGTSFIDSQKLTIQNLNVSSTVRILEANIAELIRNPVTWQYTIDQTQNTNLNCARTGGNCLNIQPPNNQLHILMDGPFNPADVNENVYYNSTNPDMGFDLSGNACVGFDPVPANSRSSCPLKVELSMWPMCDNPAVCNQVTVNVVATFRFSAPGSVGLNFNKIVGQLGNYHLSEAGPSVFAGPGNDQSALITTCNFAATGNTLLPAVPVADCCLFRPIPGDAQGRCECLREIDSGAGETCF